jgi:hypothetical protein
VLISVFIDGKQVILLSVAEPAERLRYIRHLPSRILGGIMRHIFYFLVVAFLTNTPAFSAFHSQKQIGMVLMDSRICTFFQLFGTSEADPAFPGAPWFALPKAGSNFEELFSMLLSAKLAGKAIDVTTDGTTSCGYATVATITLP